MKNKKIIFLVATVCCLAVCWLCFGAWTIADTVYSPSDFLTSLSTAYIYIIPSSNIAVSEYSNLGVNVIYTNPSDYYVYNTDFSLFTQMSGGFGRYMYMTNFNSNMQVIPSVSISSIDTSIGSYFISSVYELPYGTSFVDVPFRSNYVRNNFSKDHFRTLIVFVDKVSGVLQEQYDELLQRYEDLEYDFSDLESDYDDLYIEVQEYIALYEQELALNTALNTRIEELQARIDSLESGGSALDFIGSAFEKVGDILQIEILPNITIGTIVAVPLILGVVFLVLRLVRGE